MPRPIDPVEVRAAIKAAREAKPRDLTRTQILALVEAAEKLMEIDSFESQVERMVTAIVRNARRGDYAVMKLDAVAMGLPEPTDDDCRARIPVEDEEMISMRVQLVMREIRGDR